jgi:threonine dehydrogenase-like Zn-dependent dehydrogenase
LRKERRRVVVWGAGSKGVSFLNIFKNHGVIEFAVDINPNKIDKYIAGAGQRIVHPDFLKDYRPDNVIVLNQIYADEIRDRLRVMGVADNLLFA